ncbi:hypothetical protein [Segetibacter aerophilus]|uniref:Uncharacterized protein n=1 Tax=Segetibacter aerophilus TaxID=670293 RepID=A0A512BH34_9BACT|nr:hypothetical protein [Segetibacter aerophilus]GEO11282.1 hypothetical protein SAE01_37780 [Segetibacter aerophilus]
MVTIIFIAEDGEPVSMRFSRNEDLNTSHSFGKWNMDTNDIELNDTGWRIFETHRKEIRKLKPLLEMLEKSKE